MGLVFRTVGRLLAGFLTGPSRSPYAALPTEPDALANCLRPGDVLLVDGRQRISTAIKYLTQSTWSHAALCVAGMNHETGVLPLFVEADVVEGVRQVSLDQFAENHTRICRPAGLSDDEVAQIVAFAKSHIGDE
ncbi:MAG: lipo-like protein, partial [Alphaproteobacteria bacterium]|nr:lipo-like protein [Alphaproteobacteria bacterium]